jgi:hypothetical protein
MDQIAIVGAPAGDATAKMENLGSGAAALNSLLRRAAGGSILPFVAKRGSIGGLAPWWAALLVEWLLLTREAAL